jgi:hypothetical protein
MGVPRSIGYTWMIAMLSVLVYIERARFDTGYSYLRCR